jgi:hypothetical protein
MQQAAATLRVSEMVVRRLIAQKSLPFVPGTHCVKGEDHGAISLPPTLRKKPRRMGQPLGGLPSEGWATRPALA